MTKFLRILAIDDTDPTDALAEIQSLAR